MIKDYVMKRSQLRKLIKECVKENLQLADGDGLKNEVNQFVKQLVTKGLIRSYHRDKTSGDMNANDFTEDISHKILEAIMEWTQMANDRGNWENQPNMIK